ncbi:hypothetical protein Agabi119p4_4315 [Agaricus bisporus var. burnettii]|uniref:RNA-dependent RNA polymerase n=1 Tax=Agaricus bisporus var. burnettii TaxID=192524 RepID=A0A8H7KH90_AGABI|nr:hypothetical protein Agabi119p4_4315 [Agaricus bisporus var. burnettii]
MEIGIARIPHRAGRWDVVRAIAEVLHSGEFGNRKENFDLDLSKSTVTEYRNGGTGFLTLPSHELGVKFLRYTDEFNIRIEDPDNHRKRKLKFYKSHSQLSKATIEKLAKMPFVDPDKEEKHQETLAKLTHRFRVDSVQFGVFYRERYPMVPTEPLQPRSFSIEYKRDLLGDNSGWLDFKYDHKLMQIEITNSVNGTIGYTIGTNFSAIQKIAIGYDGKPYICFDTLTPPILESFESFRSQTGNPAKDEQKYKHRIGALDDGHRVVAAFASHLRILLNNGTDEDVLQKFVDMCKICNIPDSKQILIRCDLPRVPHIDASSRGFFLRKRLYQLRQEILRFPWPVGFHLESLLHNGRLNTSELESLLPRVRKLCQEHPQRDHAYVDHFLRKYGEVLQDRGPRVSPTDCFEQVKRKYVPPKATLDIFRCRHVTFTPTRMLMEGPYATQSNRIIRQYSGYEEFFIRVDFRDEDRLQYRWNREVDGASFVRERVGTILKDGFTIAGRQFEFLAYSSSALREHAVWFMCPFQHHDPKYGRVDSMKIREQIGNFKGTDLMKQPSKYAARLAQAFTATEASVSIKRDEWEEIEDIKPPNFEDGKPNPYLFTDGVGSISKSLGDKIWAELCSNRRDHGENSIQPSAYQIRFLGYKGVVAVDEQLDKTGAGKHMRLRNSMRKFLVVNDDVAPIEIAQAFAHPNRCYLNRPLVMLLEDLGVNVDAFLTLQDKEVAKARTIHDSIDRFLSVISEHGLGRSFRFSYLVKQLQGLGLEINSKDPDKLNVDTPFLKQVREVAMMDVMRDIKHSARILVPDSHLLVGIADEGPAYVSAGFENVYCLPPGFIYACVQESPDGKAEWLEGHCLVTRSPVAHIGDVQRVRAIGKPPQGKLCLFSHIKNALVMSSQGNRSLASCLGGGDVDGDLFQVIQYEPLLPMTYELPMEYESVGTKAITTECTVDDICDFVVEYINSDVLGLLSDRLLMIADQSKLGMNDKDCIRLAELCSQAVDYPKNGIPVDLNKEKLPHTLIRCKPDWHAAEVVSPRETDYYRSTRALGELYRNISLTEPEPMKPVSKNFELFRDPISQVLSDRVEFYIGDLVLPTTEVDQTLEDIYSRYLEELNYIRFTHTLSNTPGAKLLEAEVVAGTILAKCSQKRWRSDRIYRMRLHTINLVKEVKNELLTQKEYHGFEELVEGLIRAWRAWELSQKHINEDGANSFGFIALDVIFFILERLKADLKKTGGQVTSDPYDSSATSDFESEIDVQDPILT